MNFIGLEFRAVHRPYDGIWPYDRRLKTGTVLGNPSVNVKKKLKRDGTRRKTAVRREMGVSSGKHFGSRTYQYKSRISHEDGDKRHQEMWRHCHFGTIPLLKALNVFCSLGHFFNLQTEPDIPYRHPYRRENQKIPDRTGYGYRTTGTVYSPT
ncbi:hypothetical protein C8J56DRAFT_892168 [Mycena floridula]|nr:hypothetical protein C8J56DRAFT_892168 [Mycena floridula]